MTDADLGALTQLTVESPVVLRAAVGAVGALMLVAGARVYRVALFGSCFAVGAVGGALAFAWGGTWLSPLGQPLVIGVGAVVMGAAVVGVAAMAHRVALLGVGAMLGVLVGAAAGSLAGAAGALPGAGLGALVGALAFPWVFPWVLRLASAGVGAVSLAWAFGRPDALGWIAALWAVGTLVQFGWIRDRKPTAPIASEPGSR